MNIRTLAFFVPTRRLRPVVVVMACLAVVAARLVFAQGSGAGAGNSEAGAPFEQRFWNFLKTAQYQHWAPLPGVPSDLYPGQSPHGAFLKVYANRTALSTTEQFPVGSVIVKENYGPDRATLMAVTIMYRAENYNPQHGDWYWVKYEPDGQVSLTDAGMPIAGRAQGCINCHGGAQGDDYVFLNDPAN